MAIAQKPSPVWNVPYQRNKFFTEWDDALQRLRQELQMRDAIALSQPQAITGLGGIGKTQMALEYAYRYGTRYSAVLWVKADSSTSLASSFVELAHVLNLPERNEKDQTTVIDAVQIWLRLHAGWLLIFDNMDNLSIAEPFLPKAGPGHLLFTTRANALSGIAERVEVQPMRPEAGALLLLRRAEMISLQDLLEQINPDNRRVASEISSEMDGLPLALDQAGAYIKAESCSLAEPLLQQALAIREQQLGPVHPDIAQSLNNLAETYRAQGKFVLAEPLYKRALAIYEQQLGRDHLVTQILQTNYKALLRAMR